MTNLSRVAVLTFAVLLGVCGCKRSSIKEAPITGKSSDGAVTMTPRWQEGKRFIFRVESVTSSQVPRKNTAQIIQTETSLGQDLAFSVTNVAPDGSRVLQMEILAVQMETGRDDGITSSFDSGNKVMQVEDTPIIQRLRKFVGLKLQFHLSPSNKVTRVDGIKELSDRQSGGSNVRGAAAGVIGRYFNQQFYRDLVEMGMLPKAPVKIGDTWTVDRPANAGASGTPFPAVFTYTFRGWQQRDGANCARLEFTGEFKPASAPQTNDTAVGQIVRAAVQPKLKEGSITGQSWYSPEHTLAVETIYNQSITAKSTSVRRVRPSKSGTNSVEIVEMEGDTNAPPPVAAAPSTNGPPPIVTTNTTTTHQTTSIKLLEVEPLQP